MQLIKTLRVQLQIMIHKKNFQISFTIMLLLSLGGYLANVNKYSSLDISSIITASNLYLLDDTGIFYTYLTNLFPFIVMFPYAFSFLEDKKTRTAILLKIRMGNKYYYISQLFTCFLGGFIICFIPLIINLILTNITFVENGNTIHGPYYSAEFCSSLLGTDVVINAFGSGMPFMQIYLLSPVLYDILYTLFFSLFAGLFSVFGLAFSFHLKEHKIIILIASYLIFMLGNIFDSYLFDSDKYLNTRFWEYVSVNVSIGKNIWFFIIFCTLILIFTILRIMSVIRKDQL